RAGQPPVDHGGGIGGGRGDHRAERLPAGPADLSGPARRQSFQRSARHSPAAFTVIFVPSFSLQALGLITRPPSPLLAICTKPLEGAFRRYHRWYWSVPDGTQADCTTAVPTLLSWNATVRHLPELAFCMRKSVVSSRMRRWNCVGRTSHREI